MSWRSNECTKNTLEKSRAFEIVTDTYNLRWPKGIMTTFFQPVTTFFLLVTTFFQPVTIFCQPMTTFLLPVTTLFIPVTTFVPSETTFFPSMTTFFLRMTSDFLSIHDSDFFEMSHCNNTWIRAGEASHNFMT